MSTHGENWTHNDNWFSDTPVGSWYGVNGVYKPNNTRYARLPNRVNIRDVNIL